jgi:hypothetical protein
LIAISRIKPTVSADSDFLPFGCDRRLQTQRNSSRCQRKIVAGCTIRSVLFQVAVMRDNSTNSTRSRQDNLGFGSCRCSTINC